MKKTFLSVFVSLTFINRETLIAKSTNQFAIFGKIDVKWVNINDEFLKTVENCRNVGSIDHAQ